MASTEERLIHLEEQMETHFRETSLIREDIRDLRGRLDRFELRVEARFDKVDDRFSKVDERFDKVDERFGKVNDRFDRVDVRFDRIDARLDGFHDRLNRITAIAVGVLVTMIGGFLGIIGSLLMR